MLLGFISLLLTVSQGMIQKICIPREWTIYMLPCHSAREQAELSPSEAHGFAAGILGLSRRRLLAEGGPGAQHCQKKVHGWVGTAIAACYSSLRFQSLPSWNFLAKVTYLASLSTGRSSFAVCWSATSVAYLHFHFGHCTCDFLCFDYAFRKCKGKVSMKFHLFHVYVTLGLK